MSDGALFVLVLLALNIPVFLLIGRAMFGSWHGFWDSAKWGFVPDLWSLLRGRLLRDWAGEGKLRVYGFLCALVFFLEFIVIRMIFDPWR